MGGPITARLVMNPNSVEDKIQRPSVNAFVLERPRGASERARETEASATLCFAFCGEIIFARGIFVEGSRRLFFSFFCCIHF